MNILSTMFKKTFYRREISLGLAFAFSRFADNHVTFDSFHMSVMKLINCTSWHHIIFILRATENVSDSTESGLHIVTIGVLVIVGWTNFVWGQVLLSQMHPSGKDIIQSPRGVNFVIKVWGFYRLIWFYILAPSVMYK